MSGARESDTRRLRTKIFDEDFRCHDSHGSIAFATMRWIAVALLTVSLAAPGAALACPAYFEIEVPPFPERFVVKLTQPGKIAHARRILSGETTELTQVMGKVRRRSAPWNEPWSYILVPNSVDFFDFAVEVCDANIAYVEEHLDEVGGAFLPGRVWCPWGSRLVREVTP